MNAAVLETDSDPFRGTPTVVVILAKKDSHTRVYDGSPAMENRALAYAANGPHSEKPRRPERIEAIN